MAKTFGVVFELGAKLQSSVGSAFDTVEGRLKNLKSSLKTQQAIQSKSTALITADARLKAAQADYAANQTAEMKTKLDAAKRAFERAGRAAADYGIDVNNAVSMQNKATAAINKTEAALARQQKHMANYQKRQQLHGRIMETVAMTAAVVAPIKLAMDAETSFADIKKAHDFKSIAEEKAMHKDIMGLSGSTGLGYSGVASIYASAAEKKLATTPAEFKAFATSAAQMAVAFGVSAETAGEYLGVWRSRIGMTQEEAIRTADSMNYLGTQMDAPPAKVAAIVSSMGAVAQSAGLADAQIVALGATLAATSDSPEIAATAMKNFLGALTKGGSMTDRQKAAFRQIGFGDSKALAKAMQEDAAGTLQAVIEATAAMPKELHGALISDLFGEEAKKSLAPLLENTSLLTKAFNAVADEQNYAGSMLKEYGIQSQTAARAMARFKSTVGNLGIAIGTALLPPLTTVANAASAFIVPIVDLATRFPNLTTAVVGLGASLVALKVAMFAGAYAKTIFSDGLTVLQGATDLFTRKSSHATKGINDVRTGLVGATVAARGFSLALLANPIGLAVVAVAALAGGLYYLYNKFEPVRVAMQKLWGVMKSGALATWKTVTSVFRAAWELAVMTWNGIGIIIKGTWNLAKTAWDKAGAFFTGIWQAVKTGASTAWNGIKNKASECAEALRPIWEPIVGFFETIWDAIKAPAIATFNWIEEKLKVVVATFGTVFEKAKEITTFLGFDSKTVGVRMAVPSSSMVATKNIAPTVATSTVAATSAPASSAPKSSEPIKVEIDSASLKLPPAQNTINSPVTQTLNITMHGIPDREFAQRVMDAVRANSGHFQNMISSTVSAALARAKATSYEAS